MDLAQHANDSAANLRGVVTTLRRLYTPQFEADAALTKALAAMQASERYALPTIAAMALAPAMSGTPA